MNVRELIDTLEDLPPYAPVRLLTMTVTNSLGPQGHLVQDVTETDELGAATWEGNHVLLSP